MAKCAIPKFTSNGEYLEIGFSFPITEGIMKHIQYEKVSAIIDQIKGVDQKIHFDLEFATSLKDVISKDEALISQLINGFKFKVNLDVLSNFKKIIFEILKNPDMMEAMGPLAMGLAPVLMLQLNAKIDLDFDSFDELKDLPMFEPLLANFAQLFEGIIGSDVETMLTDRIELQEGQDLNKHLKLIIEFMHTMFDVCQNMATEGKVELAASFPNVASLNLDISSEDLGKAILLGLRSTFYEKQIKPKYEWET